MQLIYIPTNAGGSSVVVDWQPNVINIQTTPPGAPAVDDRYIVLPAGVGAWAGQDNDIATWNGASWDFETPENGWITYAETPELIYIFNGVSWNALSSEPEYREAFDDSALAAGILTVTHSLGQSYHSVTVYDDSENAIAPDLVTNVDINTVTVDLSSFAPIAGTWNVVVGG